MMALPDITPYRMDTVRCKAETNINVTVLIRLLAVPYKL
jgi:hypothetical protein